MIDVQQRVEDLLIQYCRQYTREDVVLKVPKELHSHTTDILNRKIHVGLGFSMSPFSMKIVAEDRGDMALSGASGEVLEVGFEPTMRQ